MALLGLYGLSFFFSFSSLFSPVHTSERGSAFEVHTLNDYILKPFGLIFSVNVNGIFSTEFVVCTQLPSNLPASNNK